MRVRGHHPFALKGTFLLQQTGSDPLFNYYRVWNVQWTVPDTTNTTITGSGTYRVGGEVAVQHQLSLDLSVGGGPFQHFDSGLVAGGGEFPNIDIQISLHQNTACPDTVMHVIATDPVATAVATGASSRVSSVEVSPNPFQGQTDVRLSLARPGRLDVRIYDARGRAVRHLASRAMAPSGTLILAWDGRQDQGSLCAAGVYFVGVQAGADRMTRRIAKLN